MLFRATAGQSGTFLRKGIWKLYTNSGFKYNSATTIINSEFVYDRIIDSDALAYENQLFPVEMRPFHIQNDSTFSQGTSAADSINFNTENGHAVYQGLAGDDVIELSQSAGHIIYGGSGDDIIKEMNLIPNNKKRNLSLKTKQGPIQGGLVFPTGQVFDRFGHD